MSSKDNDVTLQGRNINKMTDNEIIEYLGITDNEDKNYIYNMLVQAKEIEKKLTVEKAKKVQLDDILSLSNEWLVAIHKAENVTEIDAGLVKHLVSSVKIFEDNRVEVELNFGDQRNIFNRIISEMAGEANE